MDKEGLKIFLGEIWVLQLLCTTENCCSFKYIILIGGHQSALQQCNLLTLLLPSAEMETGVGGEGYLSGSVPCPFFPLPSTTKCQDSSF